MENAGRPSGGCLECFPPSSCSANCLPHFLPTVSFTSSQSFLVAGSLDLQDIFMWITCSNEGCDYGFVVIKVTSLCWLLPPVSSKAVELGGSSRIQAAVTTASFLTGSFPPTPLSPPWQPAHPQTLFKSFVASQFQFCRFILRVLLSVFLPAGNCLDCSALGCSHHPHAAVVSPISTDDNGIVAAPVCTSLCLTFTC